MSESTPPPPLDRRRFLMALSSGAAGTGAASALFPGALWAQIRQAGEITPEAVERAARMAGLSFTESEREALLARLRDQRESYARIRDVEVEPEVPPALGFDPGALVSPDPVDPSVDRRSPPSPTPSSAFRLIPSARSPGDVPASPGRPASDEDLAYLSLRGLGALLRGGEVTSVELTELYLQRLQRHGPELECVVTLTAELAREQARRADEEMARGDDRGPLHGIPWGAKDLLAVRDYPTTWGAAPFREQTFGYDASVVRRLEEAGAVLVAKLTLGALAMGDVWYGGRTRNPWNPSQGSSGSSAGSAAATAAGLVPFALGSETLGSIVSPATRCGVTGLRPTFGRVSRHGAMPLSWSMDKIGPLARSAEDCALVLEAIHGADGRDPVARTVPFSPPPDRRLTDLRLGYDRMGFAEEAGSFDGRTLDVLRRMGWDPVPVDLPRDLPTEALDIILDAEAAAAFDTLTRSDRDDELVRQDAGAWPNVFRSARFIPAVEYLRANRIRSLLVREMEAALDEVDVLVTPSFADPVLLMTNLTGHPAVVVPNGFGDDGPVGITFLGRLWGEAAPVRLAAAYQEETGFHLRRPPGFG